MSIPIVSKTRFKNLGGPGTFFTSRVPIESEWSSVQLPKEHWIITWIDVYTGNSITKAWNNLWGNPGNPKDVNILEAPYVAGLAQMYGSLNTSKNIKDEDFVRLTNIQSIRSRIATDASVPGSCNITLQNPLVKKTVDGRDIWERIHYKTGRFIEGSYVWYQTTRKGIDPKWCRGLLKKTDTSSKDVTLDAIDYKVIWDNQPPKDSRLEPSSFFAEDMGETILGPMQKFKVYGVNRFPVEVLTQYGYKTVLGPGTEKPIEDTDRQIAVDRLSNPKITKPVIIDQGNTLAKNSTLTPDNQTILKYARPIFTGYISDVTNQQQGPNWLLNITGKDVTCWLDYSKINVNPGVNLWGDDPTVESLLKNSRDTYPVYTIKFNGMSPEKIIETVFLGGTGGEISTDNIPLYQNSTGTSLVIGTNGASISVYRGNVTIHEKPINGRIKIGTSNGEIGWVDESYIKRTYSVYDGIGNCIKTTDSSLPIYGIGESEKELQRRMLPEYLITNPALEPITDHKVLLAYETFFRSNWPAVQSEYINKREIINTVCKTTNTECYADADGKIWFHPIWTYHDVSSPVYVIQPSDAVSWSFTFSDREVVTWVAVTGQWPYNIMANNTGYVFEQVYESAPVLGRYGVRGAVFSNPNLKNDEACRAFGLSMMRRINSNVVTGSVTIILRPEIQLARNVFIPWLNVIGYVNTIDTSIQYGRSGQTTLGLKYVRRPWEPWAPILYGDNSSTKVIQQVSSDIKTGQSKNVGTSNQTGQQIVGEAGSGTSRPKSNKTSTEPIKDPNLILEIRRRRAINMTAFNNFLIKCGDTELTAGNGKKFKLVFKQFSPTLANIGEFNDFQQPVIWDTTWPPPFDVVGMLDMNSTMLKGLTYSDAFNTIFAFSKQNGYFVESYGWPKLVFKLIDTFAGQR